MYMIPNLYTYTLAYATDICHQSHEDTKLSEVIGRFQGIAIGASYVIGIPLSLILSSHGSIHTPIYASIMLCTIGVFLSLFFLPESHPPQYVTDKEGTKSMVVKRIQWREANPLGAMHMLTSRGGKLAIGSLAYLFLNIAQTGTVVIWVNYLGYRFGWSTRRAAGTFSLLGFMVTFVPKMLV